MEFFAPLFNFVTDNTRRSLQKIVLVSFTLLALLLLDNLFGFSYYYNLSHKVTIAAQIHGILKDKELDGQTRNQLMAINRQVLGHASLKDAVYNALADYDKPTTFVHLLLFWLTASSSVVFMMIVGVIATVKALSNPAKYIFQKPIHTLLSFGIVFLMLLFVSAILTVGFAMVPLIDGHVTYNYILNICANGFILWVFTMTPLARIKPTVKTPPAAVQTEQ